MKPERTPEFQEYLKSLITIETTIDRSGVSIAELGQRAIAAMQEQGSHDPKQVATIRHRLNLSEDEDLESGITRVVNERMAWLESSLESRLESARAQALNSAAMAVERGYLTEPRPMHIYFVDKILQQGLPESEQHGTNAFLPFEELCYISLDEPNRIVTHELGHALSYRPDRQENGVLRYTEGEDGRPKGHGNVWFDEGATVMWEDRSVIDTEPKEGREDPTDFWRWSQEAVQLLTAEAGVDEEVVMKSYFGHADARKELDEALRKRFGTDIDGLEPLSERLDIAWTKRVISGQPVELPLRLKRDHHTLLESKRKLAKIFPNVTLVEQT